MTLRINGSTSGYTEIDAPAVAGSNTITLPSGNGSANQLLKNGATAGSLEFASNVVIDSSDRLLVGTSTSYATRNYLNNALEPQKQLHGIAGASSTAAITNWSNTTQGPAQFVLAKSKGTALGTRGIVANNDDIGVIAFTADDGANFIPAASILAEVDGTPGANDMPGRLVFSTTADGASSPTERVMIDSTGKLLMGGITPATSIDYSICTPGRLQSEASYTFTTATAANVVIQSSGLFLRSTSSIKYKTEVEDAELSYSEDLVYGSRPVWYRSLSESDPSDYSYWGFIAEEVAEIDPRMVHWGDDGPEGVQYDRYVVHLVGVIQKQQQRLDALEARITALEAN